MMNLYVKNNKPRELMSLFQQLSFWKLPQEGGLGYVLAMVCKLNDDKKLKELLAQMKQTGVKLNLATTDELAIYYHNTRQVSKIYELEADIRSQGLCPGSFLMSWLVYMNIELGQIDKAVDLWLEMKANKISSHGILGAHLGVSI